MECELLFLVLQDRYQGNERSQRKSILTDTSSSCCFRIPYNELRKKVVLEVEKKKVIKLYLSETPLLSSPTSLAPLPSLGLISCLQTSSHPAQAYFKLAAKPRMT